MKRFTVVVQQLRPLCECTCNCIPLLRATATATRPHGHATRLPAMATTDTHGEPARPHTSHSPQDRHSTAQHSTPQGHTRHAACPCPAPRHSCPFTPRARVRHTTTSHTGHSSTRSRHSPTQVITMRESRRASHTHATDTTPLTHPHNTRFGARTSVCALSPPCPQPANTPTPPPRPHWRMGTKVGTSGGPRAGVSTRGHSQADTVNASRQGARRIPARAAMAAQMPHTPPGGGGCIGGLAASRDPAG